MLYDQTLYDQVLYIVVGCLRAMLKRCEEKHSIFFKSTAIELILGTINLERKSTEMYTLRAMLLAYTVNFTTLAIWHIIIILSI